MESFNVINYNFNAQKFESYNVIPYFISAYTKRIELNKECPENKYWKVPKTFKEFKQFIKEESQYQFWGRCEYEIILCDWPSQKHYEKWDIHNQIMMNLGIVARIIMKAVK